MQPRHSKADLMREIDQAWTRLNSALDRLSEEQLTGISDPQGWTIKDHLVHIAAWESSVTAFIEGRPRHEGLGVDEQVYASGDDDTINAAIQEPKKNISLSEAKSIFRDAHSRLLNLLEPMSDDDLYRANSDFQPAGTSERDERPIIGMIFSNTAGHYSEHQGWIEELAKSA